MGDVVKIERGRVVRLHYTLRDDSGATIESSRGGEPLHYLHGSGQLLPALERAIAGRALGHAQTVTLAPAEGYGEHDPRGVVRAPRSALPADMEVGPGAEVQAETPEGPWTFLVVGVDGEEVVLDANHPMAGKTLTFDVEVIEVREATPEEVEHGHAHGPGGHH